MPQIIRLALKGDKIKFKKNIFLKIKFKYLLTFFNIKLGIH